MKRPRIVIAEQRLLMLEGLQRIVEPDFEVIYTARDGRNLVSFVEKAPPDVVLTGIVLPLLSGIEAISRIRKSLPNVRAVFLSGEPDRDLLSAAVHAGAAGYVVTDCSANELVTGLHEVMAGRSYITPLIAEDLLSRLRAGLAKTDAQKLSGRQREILQLIAEGYQLKEIGAMLNISHKTVEYHKYALMQSLGFRTTAQLIQYALENRLYTPAAGEGAARPQAPKKGRDSE